MKNADKPAHPCEVNRDGIGIQTGEMCGITTGFTKREVFAMAAMQGMLSACQGVDGSSNGQDHIAELAVTMADKLLKKLGD